MQLTWNNIVPNIKGTGYNMRIRTEKTETEATLPISPDALELCGPRGRGLVFKDLTRSMLNKPLKAWLAAAGITKHITFHCFRHTYAVLQLASGTDIYTVSKDVYKRQLHCPPPNPVSSSSSRRAAASGVAS